MRILSSTVFPKTCIMYPNTMDLFITENKLGYTKYIFDGNFIHLIRYALSTDCISEFSEEQLELFTNWLNYSVALLNGQEPMEQDDVVVQLDALLVRLTDCTPEPFPIVCGNSNLHTHTDCPN